jgi:UDP-2,3-diacylglucosamine hydrolase
MFNKSEMIAVSDIHLQNMDDSRTRLLLEVIDAATAASTPCFALLGDIFDFCLGSQRYFHSKFRPLWERLETLAAGGTRVIFVEGNHEFKLNAGGWRGIEVVSETSTERGIVWRASSGTKILLTHGDLFNAPREYIAFRALIKSNPTLLAASLVPGRLIDAYALQHARISRSMDDSRTLDDAAILGAASELARQRAVDHVIFGHFHRPWAVPIQSDDPTRLALCMDSWDKPNLLMFDGKRFSRAFFGGSFDTMTVTDRLTAQP